MSLYEENETIRNGLKKKMRDNARKSLIFKFKVAAIVAAILIILALSFKQFIGNKTFFDTVYTFNYAIIELPNGDIVEGEVKEWNDYEGDQLQVIFKGTGEVYLVHSEDCALIKK